MLSKFRLKTTSFPNAFKTCYLKSIVKPSFTLGQYDQARIEFYKLIMATAMLLRKKSKIW